ncbi:uncharacterized protein BCR38DRAFT_429897 [Pseudomassariella vexata]|uniref:Uncharacterized protein n=1 Tax=Pseudomassariella vexata TaxID=1141098 RepID=A0A1Y2E4V4_9PEZI|nr:uncharacterized protein BCR38DRAFT_429897 [Pseudomassariella vexata]ORY66326.1 hypothetical protein BCR38DRAFT_429897 [Pseudomassariella vexata]
MIRGIKIHLNDYQSPGSPHGQRQCRARGGCWVARGLLVNVTSVAHGLAKQTQPRRLEKVPSDADVNRNHHVEFKRRLALLLDCASQVPSPQVCRAVGSIRVKPIGPILQQPAWQPLGFAQYRLEPRNRRGISGTLSDAANCAAQKRCSLAEIGGKSHQPGVSAITYGMNGLVWKKGSQANGRGLFFIPCKYLASTLVCCRDQHT